MSKSINDLEGFVSTWDSKRGEWSVIELLSWATIGLTEEAGEVAGVMKKAMFYRKPTDPLKIDPNKLLNEAGDTLNYLAAVLHLQGFTLEDAAKANMEKMKMRFPDGWNPDDALARKDEELK